MRTYEAVAKEFAEVRGVPCVLDRDGIAFTLQDKFTLRPLDEICGMPCRPQFKQCLVVSRTRSSGEMVVVVQQIDDDRFGYVWAGHDGTAVTTQAWHVATFDGAKLVHVEPRDSGQFNGDKQLRYWQRTISAQCFLMASSVFLVANASRSGIAKHRPSRKQRKRMQAKSIPTDVFRVVEIKPTTMTENSLGDGEPRSMRYHLVRGHWRLYTKARPHVTGYVGFQLVRPHHRGDIARGSVQKDYEITR